MYSLILEMNQKYVLHQITCTVGVSFYLLSMKKNEIVVIFSKASKATKSDVAPLILFQANAYTSNLFFHRYIAAHLCVQIKIILQDNKICQQKVTLLPNKFARLVHYLLSRKTRERTCC